MRDQLQWSVSLGRWGGVQVRLHLFFILFAAFTLYLIWLAAQQEQQLALIGCLSLAVLVLSVLAHEGGHVWACRRLGEHVDLITLWPLGGLSPPERIRQPQAELIIQMAGPLANLALAAICLPLLLVDNPSGLLGLANPLRPEGVTVGTNWMVFWKLVFWVNWVLALVNLFPAVPFDGGRILRAALVLRWGEDKRARATQVVTLAAQAGAILLLVVAFLTRNWQLHSLMPTWFALVLLAIFLFFSAQQERARPQPATDSDDLPFGYDFSQGYTSLERSSAEVQQEDIGPITRWLEERRETRLRRQQEIEQEEDRRMDEILARISTEGIEGLTPEERSILERVSQRYRQRGPQQ